MKVKRRFAPIALLLAVTVAITLSLWCRKRACRGFALPAKAWLPAEYSNPSRNPRPSDLVDRAKRIEVIACFNGEDISAVLEPKTEAHQAMLRALRHAFITCARDEIDTLLNFTTDPNNFVDVYQDGTRLVRVGAGGCILVRREDGQYEACRTIDRSRDYLLAALRAAGLSWIRIPPETDGQ